MFGSKKCLVSVLLVWVVLTVAQGVPVENDDQAPSPMLNRQKRTFFSTWWPYSGTEDHVPPVQPYYRITIRGQTQAHRAVENDWNNQFADEIIAELEAAHKSIDITLQKLKNLSKKKLYNSGESDEDESGERKPPAVVRTTRMPPQLKPHPTTPTPTTTKTDLEGVIVNPATTENSQKVEPATSTPNIDIRFKPDEDVKKTTSATVEVRPEQPATTTAPDTDEVRPVEPATTTPAAVEVRPRKPATITTSDDVEVRPLQPATTNTTSDNTNEKVEPQQQMTTTETQDVKIQPDQPATTTVAEDSANRIRPQTTPSTTSDDNADVKTEPQQQATTAATATVENSAAVENLQPEQPAIAEDSSATAESKTPVESRYAAESASLENWKNNKKKMSWDYYLKKRAPLNEKAQPKLEAGYF